MVVEFASRVLRVAAAFAATVGLLACATVQPPRSPEEQAADQAITAQVKAALHSSRAVYDEHIDVDTNHSVVQLSGWVYSARASQAATEISQAVPGVQRVNNGLEVVEPGGAAR
jgi:osmotically-inducible protein OsmY